LEEIRRYSYSEKNSELFSSMIETPFEGIGKPEALKHNLAGYMVKTY
jgi:Txe/YoeB family toxin of Txe-Axe toxin-antitoxin module